MNLLVWVLGTTPFLLPLPSQLEGKIGAPDPKVQEAMEREHTASKDSQAEFTTDNYGITTTSETEWNFVVAPESRREWPVERRLAAAPEKQRQPLPLAGLRESLAAQNVRLEALGEPPLLEAEAIGGRLYTGLYTAPAPAIPLSHRDPPFLDYATKHTYSYTHAHVLYPPAVRQVQQPSARLPARRHRRLPRQRLCATADRTRDLPWDLAAGRTRRANA